MGAAPLTETECSELFKPLNQATSVALAVSGGADSLALMVAVARWRERRGAPNVIVLTVDHGLRPESAIDADKVIREARRLGLEASGLVVDEPPSRNIELAAREARYRLLVGAARTGNCSHLLVAHHLEDQAETFLMRLSRGAGVFGLAAMRPVVMSSDLVVFRPFLGVERSRLRATVVEAGLEPCEDPMNSDPRFERARLRAAWPRLEAMGIDARRLVRAAGRFADEADAIDGAVDRLLDSVSVTDLGVIEIPLDLMAAIDRDIGLRLLSRVVMAVGDTFYPPRGVLLSALERDLHRGSADRIKRTVSGVVIERRRDMILAYREFGRKGLERRSLQPSKSIRWDGRFAVTVGDTAPPGLVVGPLGDFGRRQLDHRPAGVPAAVLDTIPAVWRGDDLVAVPTLPQGLKSSAKLPIAMTEVVSERLGNPPRFPAFDPD